MKTSHFYAYGIIANEPGSFAAEFGLVSAKQIADFIQASKDSEELVVHINSQGGDVDEGFAIHDLLTTSGKKITTIIEGMCASIATVVALAGTKREMTENATFFIHNAWGGAIGDAEELQKYADAVKAATDKIIDFYVSKTGADRAAIADMMNSDTSMTADQAKQIGFITEVKKAIAAKIITIAKSKDQSIENKIKDIMKNETRGLISAIKDLLNIKNEDQPIVAMALDVETDKGVLHIETPLTEGLVSVGDVCTIDGNVPAEGDYTTNDGTVYALDAEGKVTAVTVAPDNSTEDVAALKAEIETLKADLAKASTEKEALKAEKEAFEQKITAELTAIKANISSNYTPPKDKNNFNKGVKPGDVDPKAELKDRKNSYAKK